MTHYDPATALSLSANLRAVLLGPSSTEPGWYVYGDAAPELTTRDILSTPVRSVLRNAAWVPCDPTTIAKHAARTFGHGALVSLEQQRDGSWEYSLRFQRNGEPAVIYGCGRTRHDAAIDLLRMVMP